MKAVICPKYGPPEVLEIREIEKPVPKDNEILIKVVSTTVTSGDCRMRAFNVPKGFRLPAKMMMGFTKPRKPIFGVELAGVITEVGSKVTKFKVGDEVFAAAGFGPGAHAEYRCFKESGPVVTKPENIPFEQAGAIPFGGLSALFFLKKAKIKEGHKILIYGASGAVGTASVQLAKHFRAEVTGICGSSNVEMVKSLGADKVIDYSKDDFTQNGETYDIIFDAVGKTTFGQCKNSLVKKGVYLTVEMTGRVIRQMIWTSMFGSKKVRSGVGTEEVEDMEFLKGLLESGELKAVIDRRFTLDEIVEAHRYVDTGHKKGNVAITVQH